MRQPFQLPSINALIGDDKDVLRQIFTQLVAEVNELRREVTFLSTQSNKGKGY
jgi:hypothetical protein